MKEEYDSVLIEGEDGDELELEEEEEEDTENLQNRDLGIIITTNHTEEDVDVDHMAVLITAVEQRPILYASQGRGNGGNGREFNLTKEKAWAEVSYIVGKEVVWCTRKWKSLRDTFVKKVNSLRGKNASVRRKIQSWTYFSSLTFLSDYIHHQSTATKNRIAQHREEVVYTQKSMQAIVPRIVTTDFLEIGIQEENPRRTTPTSSNSNSMTRIINNLNNAIQSQSPSSVKRERDRESNDDASQELWKRPCLENVPDKKLDAHDYFCMSLAQQMRNFSATRSSEARMRISQIMFEIESGSE